MLWTYSYVSKRGQNKCKFFYINFRTSSSFDALRGRYFPGGHEGGLDTDLMLKQMAGEHMENINARYAEYYKTRDCLTCIATSQR